MIDAPVTETLPAATPGLDKVFYRRRDGIAYVTVNWRRGGQRCEHPRQPCPAGGAWSHRRTPPARDSGGQRPAARHRLRDGDGHPALLFCAGAEDKKEGISTLLEKRAPQFEGR